MRGFPRGWIPAALLIISAGLTGCSATPAAAPAGEPDQPQLNAAERDGDADAGALVDKDSKGSPAQAFTVPGHSVHIDASTLKSAPPAKKERPEVETELIDNGSQDSRLAPAEQTAQGALAAPAPIVNVKGLDFNTFGAGHPPDTNGAVGPNHFVQTVNTSIGIFAKSTGARVAAFTFNDFFANSGTAQCDAENGGDPTVIFDIPSGKWVIADFGFASVNQAPFFECVAVSAGSDPVNTTWTFYSVPAGDGRFPDYPKFGSGPDGVYFTTNNFQGNTYTGAGVYAIKRESLGTASLQVQHVTTSSTFFSLLAANLNDPPVAGAPEVIASVWNSRLTVWSFKVDWTNTANTRFTQLANIAVSYRSVGRIRTPGEQVDSLSPRSMNVAQQRGGSLWLTQTVSSGNTSGIRWYEVTNLSTTPSIRQQGTFAPNDGQFRWMPSASADKRGNMMVGYNLGNASKNPAIRYAGRLATDPLGTLGQSETSLIEGTGAPSSGNFNRWGDYGQMNVDPVDGCTFWFTTEYYETTGANWQTRIGSFRFASCT